MYIYIYSPGGACRLARLRHIYIGFAVTERRRSLQAWCHIYTCSGIYMYIHLAEPGGLAVTERSSQRFVLLREFAKVHLSFVSTQVFCGDRPAYVSIRQHSIRQHTSAYVSIRQQVLRGDRPAYVSICQHSICQHTSAHVSRCSAEIDLHTSAHNSA
jgi:hypothetical protein